MKIKIQKVLLFDKDDRRVPMILDEWEWHWFSAGCIMESALKAMDAGNMSRPDCERLILTTARVAHARANDQQENSDDIEIVQSFINREEGHAYVLPPAKEDVSAGSAAKPAERYPTEEARAKAATLRKRAKELVEQANELVSMLGAPSDAKFSGQ
jgi:hypothetical protein